MGVPAEQQVLTNSANTFTRKQTVTPSATEIALAITGADNAAGDGKDGGTAQGGSATTADGHGGVGFKATGGTKTGGIMYADGDGIQGESVGGNGVSGTSSTGFGVFAASNTGPGVFATSNTGPGVYASSFSSDYGSIRAAGNGRGGIDCSPINRLYPNQMGMAAPVGYCDWAALEEEVTIAEGSGAAGVATTIKVPNWALVIGAAVKIKQAPGGGATTLDVGITGSGNLDALIDGMSTALNTRAASAGNNDGTQLPLANTNETTITLTTNFNVTGASLIVNVAVYFFKLYPKE